MVQYTDKVTGGQVTAGDMNNIKNSVNDLYRIYREDFPVTDRLGRLNWSIESSGFVARKPSEYGGVHLQTRPEANQDAFVYAAFPAGLVVLNRLRSVTFNIRLNQNTIGFFIGMCNINQNQYSQQQMFGWDLDFSNQNLIAKSREGAEATFNTGFTLLANNLVSLTVRLTNGELAFFYNGVEAPSRITANLPIFTQIYYPKLFFLNNGTVGVRDIHLQSVLFEYV